MASSRRPAASQGPAKERIGPSQRNVMPEHKGFILAEDEALKLLVEQLTLPDGQGNEKAVRCWFRYPEPEVQITYPFATIDLIGVNPAYDLWTSLYWQDLDEEVEFDSSKPELVITGHRLHDPSTAREITVPSGMTTTRVNYLAYRLIYQVGLWANNAFHDRLMTARMIRDIIHPRPSWLHCPADGVWKRMEVLGWAPADLPTQEGGSKRIFRKMITMSVQTEIPQDRIEDLEIIPFLRKVSAHVEDINTGDQLIPSELSQYWETLHEAALP